MGKVTALHLDTITEKSGSQHAGSWSDPTAPTGRGSHGGGFPGAPPHQD